MRSTRASAAWAGMALATSFLSVAITSMQPHTTATTTTVAANVTLPSSRNENSLERVDAASGKISRVDSRSTDGRTPWAP